MTSPTMSPRTTTPPTTPPTIAAKFDFLPPPDPGFETTHPPGPLTPDAHVGAGEPALAPVFWGKGLVLMGP